MDATMNFTGHNKMCLKEGHQLGIIIRGDEYEYTMVEIHSVTEVPSGYNVKFVENPIPGETTWLDKEFIERCDVKYKRFKRGDIIKNLLKDK